MGLKGEKGTRGRISVDRDTADLIRQAHGLYGISQGAFVKQACVRFVRENPPEALKALSRMSRRKTK